MKKKLLISLVILIVFSGSIVFAKDYKDAEPVIKELVVSLEKFIAGLEKAETAHMIASVLNEYSKAMNGYAPRFIKIMKKYPELADENTHPESLKPLIFKMEEMTKKLIEVFSKINAHMNDPEVKAAFEEMNKASAKMDAGEDDEGEEK